MLNFLPVFPKFTLLSLDLRSKLEAYTHQFAPNGDYNFISLWCYDVKDDISVSNLNGNLVVKFRDYLTADEMYSILGTSSLKDSLQEIFSYQESHKLEKIVKLVPEAVIKAESSLDTLFSIEEDRDNFDYILSVEEIKELIGKRFHTHRNHINTFNRLFPEYSVEVHTALTPDVRASVETLFTLWEAKKNSTEGNERTAFTKLLNAAEQFQLLILILKISGEPTAFSISDIHHPQVSQIHFAKSNPDVRQGYYILNQALAKKLHELGIKYINLENDMGIPGLRYAKEQWNPSHYVKKFTITPKT